VVAHLAECDAWRQGLTVAINLSPRDVTREGAVDRSIAWCAMPGPTRRSSCWK
jgi:predicted signal transduction protein with EAL and GGDEF domain